MDTSQYLSDVHIMKVYIIVGMGPHWQSIFLGFRYQISSNVSKELRPPRILGYREENLFNSRNVRKCNYDNNCKLLLDVYYVAGTGLSLSCELSCMILT